MDFGDLLKQSWDLFIKEIVTLVIFTLVGVVLSMTIVLIPTVAAGLVRGYVGYVRDGRVPEYSELWNFEGYVDVLIWIIVLSVLLSIGYTLLIIPGIILTVWWMYSGYYLVDRNMGFWEAMTASKEAVGQAGFIQHFIVLLIVTVLNSVGSAVAGLGTILTAPFTLLLMTLVYLQISGGAASEGR